MSHRKHTPVALTLGLALLTTTSARAQDAASTSNSAPTDLLTCTVVEATPVSRSFFGLVPDIGAPPTVGDTIVLDPTALKLTELTFASGNEIPLSRFGASMKRVPSERISFASWSGIQPGFLGYYEGDLTVAFTAGGAVATLQIVKTSRAGEFQNAQLSSLTMQCIR